MINCPKCGDYLRESIVRGPEGRIQIIDVEVCRRPSCRPPMSPRHSFSANGGEGKGSWLGDVFDGVTDFFGDLWK